MGQKIVNKPDITTIGGSYIGGNINVNIYYNEQQKDDIDKINSIKTIFLSYNWHDSGIADRIDRHLSRLSDVIVKRDVRDIGPWKSIRKFMKSIRQQDYAVLIVSDLYLRSKNCMFEVMEIMKEPEYENRIFPAVVENGIYNPLVRAGYIKYWQQECDKLETAIMELGSEYITELAAELKQYKSITFSIGKFLSIVADRNNPDITDIELQIEKVVLGNYTEQNIKNNFKNVTIGEYISENLTNNSDITEAGLQIKKETSDDYMEQDIRDGFKNIIIDKYIGMTNINNYYISMFQDLEREFVVTRNTNIKPVSYFIGRETELQDLRQKIEAGHKSVLVSGMGGIGKTHICRKLFEEYINKHAGGENIPFSHIGYIEYNGDMGSSLQNCLKYKEQDSPEQNQEAAWEELEYLAADGKLLLFVDNVNVPIKEDRGLNRLNGIPGTVVMTSRRTFFSNKFEPYRIGFLSIGQCKKFYEKIRYGNNGKKILEEDVSDLECIIEEMVARHTITIEHLAHLARVKHWTVKRLRNELEERGFQIEYRDEGNKLVNIQKLYETMYDLSMLTKAEQSILEAFSVFPYISLTTKICNEWMLADAGVNGKDDVLIDLYKESWLQFDMEQDCYSLHPVFAKFIYEKCKPGADAHHGLIEACQNCLEIPESGSAIECQKYIPLAENILEKIDMGMDMEQVKFMDSLAFLLEYKREHRKAENLYKKCIEICEKELGEEHPSTAISYNNLAGVYYNQGKYKEVEELYKKCIQIHGKMLGEEHLITASSYNNLAMVYANQGKYTEAEELYKKAIYIREKMLGRKHPSITTSYNNIAWVYGKKRMFEMSLIYYYKAYKNVVSKFGLNNSDAQIVYKNLELTYKDYNPEGDFKQWLEEKMKETE